MSKILFSLLFPLFLLQGFDRGAFYSDLADGNSATIDQQLDILGSTSVKEKTAYEGSLLMRKAGLATVPAQKLKLFKEGRTKLETAIAGDSTNAEYRFLRLIIQEQAPKIVRYRGQLEADKRRVLHAFPELPQAVRQAIVSYAKSSSILRGEDLPQ